MSQWINVRHALPLNDTEVTVKMLLLWRTQKQAWFLKNYFNCQGENITKWVTHWKPAYEN
jgi:hypothetical protein